MLLIHPAVSCFFPKHLTLIKCLNLDSMDNLSPVSLSYAEERCCQIERVSHFQDLKKKKKSSKEFQNIISVLQVSKQKPRKIYMNQAQ